MLKLKYYLFLCSSSTSNVWGKFDSEELLIMRQKVIELTSNMLWFVMLTFWIDWCTQAAEDEELEGLHLLRQDNFVKHFFLSQSLVTMIWQDTCEGQMWKWQFIIIGKKKSFALLKLQLAVFTNNIDFSLAFPSLNPYLSHVLDLEQFSFFLNSLLPNNFLCPTSASYQFRRESNISYH